MGIMVYSFLWVMQDFDHQPYGAYGYATNPKTQSSAGRRAPLKRKSWSQSPKDLEALEFWGQLWGSDQGSGFRV